MGRLAGEKDSAVERPGQVGARGAAAGQGVAVAAADPIVRVQSEAGERPQRAADVSAEERGEFLRRVREAGDETLLRDDFGAGGAEKALDHGPPERADIVGARAGVARVAVTRPSGRSRAAVDDLEEQLSLRPSGSFAAAGATARVPAGARSSRSREPLSRR